jgi:hypothetical protein
MGRNRPGNAGSLHETDAREATKKLLVWFKAADSINQKSPKRAFYAK